MHGVSSVIEFLLMVDDFGTLCHDGGDLMLSDVSIRLIRLIFTSVSQNVSVRNVLESMKTN